MRQRDRRQRAIAEHRFFGWLHGDSVPLADRLTFAPVGAFFIMQFRDMNLWVLRFPEPRNEFEWVINLGSLEDEKHSRLFLEDWRKLGLDTRLGWRTADVLWWLFLSPDQEPFRRSGIDFIRLAVADGDNALLRFGHSEAGEATGHVMLSNTSAVARQLSAQTGAEYRYFGPFHLDLESGHVGNTEGIFETVVLDPAQRAAALKLCDGMFGIFEHIFDGFHAYATTYIDQGKVPQRPELPAAGDNWVAPALRLTGVDGHDAALIAHIEEHKRTLRAHPFYAWLREDSRSAVQRLRRFIPMWVTDILGYRDLNKYAMTYPDPANAAQRAVNSWAARLAGHSELFLSDWDALSLDDALGHTASGALEWLFLDPDMDLHRGNMIGFAKLALRHDDPAARWWTMVALEATGEEFFAQIRPLALAAEAETGKRLDYLAGRHDAPDTAADTGGPVPGQPPAPLGAEQLGVAKQLVDHIFHSMERQLWRSLAIARAGKYTDQIS